jgi:hypothetical protein
MYAVALTTIPPRLPRLRPVLDSLLAQRPAPARVLLCLPPAWARFAAPADLPALPAGVEVLRAEADFGPATKAITPARALAGRLDRLIYCDDDWLLPPGWAARLLAARAPGAAVAATGFGVERLKRRSHRAGDAARLTDIAQGWSGVLVDPAWLCRPDIAPPPAAWPVDDIWLSGQLARQGIPVRLAPAARAGLVPAFADSHALQDAVIDGRARDAANRACCDVLTARYGVWPPL